MENKVYTESQSFLTWWLTALFIGFLGYECLDILEFGPSYSVKLSLSVGFWIISTVFVAFILMRLRTRVDETGIEVSFLPFVYKKKWSWADVSEVYSRKYSIVDFGGWGYRIGSQGVAYNTKGSDGIQLVLKNAKKIMIGTQHPEEFQQYIDFYFKKAS